MVMVAKGTIMYSHADKEGKVVRKRFQDGDKVTGLPKEVMESLVNSKSVVQSQSQSQPEPEPEPESKSDTSKS